MEYQVSVNIAKSSDFVTSEFINKTTMPQWEKGLTRIEELNGTLFDTGSEGFLVFSFQGQEMKMKVTVLDSHLPEEITIVYEVPGAYNKCGNLFQNQGETTLWTMEVLFEFDQPNDYRLEAFIYKTRAGMVLFQEYVEGL